MTQTFNVIIEEGEDGYLISEVVELSGCHTQAKTHDELIARTREAITLYLSVEEPDIIMNAEDDIDEDDWMMQHHEIRP